MTIRQAEGVTLYEGLPHPMYEAASLDAEKGAKPTVELRGFPFYRETLDLKAGDGEELKRLLGDARTYKPFSGEKKCGGFHPDYAVAWTAGGQEYFCLICFGCGEFLVSGPGGEVRYDIELGARERLQRLLKPYLKNRPPRDSSGP